MAHFDKNVLKINALNRLVQEYSAYKGELMNLKGQLRAAEAKSDAYAVRRLTLVYSETEKMIPVIKQMALDAMAPVKQLKNEQESELGGEARASYSRATAVLL